eukprot:COSAG03_NODE_3726_length_1857_cov_428.260523_2_plen_229_part_00
MRSSLCGERETETETQRGPGSVQHRDPVLGACQPLPQRVLEPEHNSTFLEAAAVADAASANLCLFAYDGECDDGGYCEQGTDAHDCSPESPALSSTRRRLEEKYHGYGYGYGSSYGSSSSSSGSSSTPTTTILLSTGPAVHVLLLPIFMIIKKRHGNQQVERRSRGSGSVETQLDANGPNVVFNIKFTLPQKIFIFFLGQFIDLGTAIIRLFEIVGANIRLCPLKSAY